MTTNIDCGCRIENTGMKEIGTHKPVLVIRHCRLHACAADLRSALIGIMGDSGNEPGGSTESRAIWKEADDALHRADGDLRCCACDQWCTDENPAYNFDDGDEDFSLKCTDHFGLVHMVGYPTECFDDNGGAVLCTNCINEVSETKPAVKQPKSRWHQVHLACLLDWMRPRTQTDGWDLEPPNDDDDLAVICFTDKTAIAFSPHRNLSTFWIYKEAE